MVLAAALCTVVIAWHAGIFDSYLTQSRARFPDVLQVEISIKARPQGIDFADGAGEEVVRLPSEAHITVDNKKQIGLDQVFDVDVSASIEPNDDRTKEIIGGDEDITEPDPEDVLVPPVEDETKEKVVEEPPHELPLCVVDEAITGSWKILEVSQDVENRLVEDYLTQTRANVLASYAPKAVHTMAHSGYMCPNLKFYHFCYRRSPQEAERAYAAAQYKWQTNDCRLLDFDADTFAKIVGKHGLLFVGDSLNEEMFISLACLVGNSSTLVQLGHVRKISFTDMPRSVDFIRNDYLVNATSLEVDDIIPADRAELAELQHFGASASRDLLNRKMLRKYLKLNSDFQPHWQHLLADKKYLLLNTGAHWANVYSDDENQLAAFTNMTHHLAELFTKKYPDVVVFIRGLAAGHRNCKDYVKPASAPMSVGNSAGEYNWHLFPAFNKAWRTTINSIPQPHNLHFIDISMTDLRPDGHSLRNNDCLHYCLPGPPDLWNQLLSHAILQNEQKVT